MGLYQPIAVEEHAISGREGFLPLLVVHPRHKPQGHTPGPEFGRQAFVPAARKVVTGVGVSQPTLLRIEDSVEAGNEHVGRNVGKEDFVGLLQRPPRGVTPSLWATARSTLWVLAISTAAGIRLPETSPATMPTRLSCKRRKS